MSEILPWDRKSFLTYQRIQDGVIHIIARCRKNLPTSECVNLAWSMKSGVWKSIPNLGFTSKNGITKHFRYLTPMSTTEC